MKRSSCLLRRQLRWGWQHPANLAADSARRPDSQDQLRRRTAAQMCRAEKKPRKLPGHCSCLRIRGGGSPEDIYMQMYDDGFAKVFSTSWDCAEDSCGSGEIPTRHGWFNMMIGTGWTLMNSSGDQGATGDCATTVVNFPASDPDVVGVGGTFLSLYSNGTFQSEVAWTGGTAAKSCSTNHGGSTGGCSTVFGVPGFQSGGFNGACGGSGRSVPDISLNAIAGQNIFFNGGLLGVIGSSIASPEMAGFFAQEGAYLVYLANVTGNSCGDHSGSGEPCEPVDGGMGNGNTYLYYFGEHPSYWFQILSNIRTCFSRALAFV